MSDITRKLATIRRIAEIKLIEGADKICQYRVDGWWCIGQKDLYKIDQLVIYFEIDSFIPIRHECVDFLKKNSFKSTKNLGDGYRIKTMKMRGVVSQGLIMPIEDFPDLNIPMEEGYDVTEILGIQKYEKPISATLYGIARGNFPSFISKTDQERYQNLRNYDLEKYKDIPFEVTIKLDGSSMTAYFKDGYFGVCSRNLDLKDDAENNFKELDGSDNAFFKSENVFWKIARNLDLKNILTTIGLNIALQGELCGPGIQGNPLELKDHSLFIFDIYDINKSRYYAPLERMALIDIINKSLNAKLQHVPFLMCRTFDDILFDDNFIHSMADNAKININEKEINAEGLVFKSNDGKFSFKMISNLYLLNEGD